MFLQPQHKQLLVDILATFLPPQPLTVYAFGSRTRQSPRPDSDLDLLVEAPGPIALSTLAQLREALEESALPFRVDIVLRSDVSPEFYRRIQDDLMPLVTFGNQATDVTRG